MRHIEAYGYYKQLLVAKSATTGAIYFCSESEETFNKLADEFEKEYPKVVDDVEYWSSYIDTVNGSNAIAFMNGAFLPCHLHPEVRDYTQTIFKVLIYDGETIWTHHCTTRKKATQYITRKINENTPCSKIVLQSIVLDTNHVETLREYKRDEHDRIVKVKVA